MLKPALLALLLATVWTTAGQAQHGPWPYGYVAEQGGPYADRGYGSGGYSYRYSSASGGMVRQHYATGQAWRGCHPEPTPWHGPCDCHHREAFYAPGPNPPWHITYPSGPPMRVYSEPVYVPSGRVDIYQPPIYVEAPPVRVAPTQIYVHRPEVRVQPSQVIVDPPQIHSPPCPSPQGCAPGAAPRTKEGSVSYGARPASPYTHGDTDGEGLLGGPP